MIDTVYPPEKIDAGLRQKLAEDHPQALIILHPAFAQWLLFEIPKGSPWTAQRLWEAMAEHHSNVQKMGLYAAPTPKWTSDRGAPVMRDHLPRRPGSWLIEWLNRNDLWRYPGGAKAWLEEIEQQERTAEQQPMKTVSDMNYELTHETTFPLHAADILRGDPLAGKRKWRQTVPGGLKKHGKRKRTDDVKATRRPARRTRTGILGPGRESDDHHRTGPTR